MSTLSLVWGGTVIVLKKVNQDKYAAEYCYRDSNMEAKCFVRHSTYTPKYAARPMDRHNLELTTRIFGVNGAQDEISRAYFVIENPSTGNASQILAYPVNAVGVLMNDDPFCSKLVNWEVEGLN